MSFNPHLQEEMDFAFGPRLWDATPGVCCAAFQLGACSHTEAYQDDLYAYDEDLVEAPIPGPVVQPPDVPAEDEPF